MTSLRRPCLQVHLPTVIEEEILSRNTVEKTTIRMKISLQILHSYTSLKNYYCIQKRLSWHWLKHVSGWSMKENKGNNDQCPRLTSTMIESASMATRLMLPPYPQLNLLKPGPNPDESCLRVKELCNEKAHFNAQHWVFSNYGHWVEDNGRTGGGGQLSRRWHQYDWTTYPMLNITFSH